jgi:hypothetical protein
MGLPFTRPSVYFGQIVTAGSASLKAQAPNWTGAQFTKTPHFVKIRSGAGAGRTFLISANTGDTLSVDAEGKVDRSGALGELNDVSLGGDGKDLLFKQVGGHGFLVIRRGDVVGGGF